MELPKRKSPRIRNFDYASENYYFVTVCTHKKNCIFGSVNGENQFGRIVEKTLLQIPEHFDNVEIDAYIVMPNHIHAIIAIKENDNSTELTKIIGLFKSTATREIHKHLPNVKVWQTSFYDHIIRTQDEYIGVCKYIEDNRLKLKCMMNGDI